MDKLNRRLGEKVWTALRKDSRRARTVVLQLRLFSSSESGLHDKGRGNNLSHNSFYVDACPVHMGEVSVALIEDKCKICSSHANSVEPLPLDERVSESAELVAIFVRGTPRCTNSEVDVSASVDLVRCREQRLETSHSTRRREPSGD